MRLYEGRTLMTNPRKVSIYLSEKGIEIERIYMDMRGGEGRTADFLAKNPAGQVPVLELDDGDFLPESAAILEYLEELYPFPPLIGLTPSQRARTRAVTRIANDFIMRNGAILGNTHPFLPTHRPGYVQFPEAVPASLGPRDKLLMLLDHCAVEHPFLAGEGVTIADCTLFAGLHVHCELFDYEIPASAHNLRSWYARFSERPSAAYQPPGE